MCVPSSRSDEASNANTDGAILTALQNEVDFYRQNQSIVEQEIKTLIADNEKLSQQVGVLLHERMEASRNSQVVDVNNVNREIEELKKQLNVITKERDSLNVLWQTSQKTVEALETELTAYNGYEGLGNRNGGSESRKALELKLETSLNDYIELENRYKEATTKNNSLENEIKSKDKEILCYKERGKEFDGILKQFDDCKTQLAAERKSNEDLKIQLTLSQKEIVNYVKKEAEAKAKVVEALQLYDFVTVQRDEAFKKISECTEEVSELKKSLVSTTHEAECEYRREIEQIKQSYNEKVADMLSHIQNMDRELVEKGLLLNKTMRENKVLQTTNEDLLVKEKERLSSVEPKLALAEQRLEGMFQELLASERRNIQLVSEKQCIVLDIQRLQEIQSRESKRRDWEERLMKNEADELRMQVDHLQKSLQESHEMINKLQEILSSRTQLNQKKEEEFSTLNKHLQKQMELNKRWKQSYMEMTEKLKKRFTELQNENKTLKEKIKCASSSVHTVSEVSSSS